jgi:hypothetical protein
MKLLKIKDIKTSLFTGKSLMIIILLIAYSVSFFGDTIPVYEGFGWDGRTLKLVAEDGINHLMSFNLKWYKVFRVFPFIGYNALTYFGIPKDNQSILCFFKLFNILVLLLSVRYYFKAAASIKLEQKTTLLGFSLLFFNFPILKMFNYYPMLNDHFSFLLSLAGVYYVFSNKSVKFTFVVFLSLFTFPSLAVILTIIKIFPNNNGIKLLVISKSVIKAILKSMYVIVPFAMIALYFYWYNKNFIPINNITKINNTYLFLSSLALGLYFFFLNVCLIKAFKTDTPILISLKSGLLFLSLIMLYLIIRYSYLEMYGVYSTSLTISYLPLVMPLNFIVYHFFSFGLIIMFILITMPTFLRTIKEISLGYLLSTLLILFLFINTESRILTNVMPVVLFPLLIVINRRLKVSNSQIAFVSIFNLLLSRFYFKINQTEDMGTLMLDNTSFSQFPVQYYFMNQGPWVSYTMYFYELMCFAVAFALLFVYLGINRKNLVSNISH